MLGACAAPPPAGRAATWQRIGFQSGDDTVRRPSDPSRYPLAFGANGDVMMQPDRTRETGSWSAEASHDGQSGSLRIGPLAVTRAMCPAAPMGEQTVRDVDHVRG